MANEIDQLTNIKSGLKFLPPNLRALYNQMLGQLAGGVSQDETNALNLAAKSRERGLLDRFGSQMAGRGIGGGLGNQGQLEISRGVSNELFGNIAKADAAARSEAVRAMLGLGDIQAKMKSARAAMMGAKAQMVGARGQNRYYDWLKDQQILAANALQDPTGGVPGAAGQISPAPELPANAGYGSDGGVVSGPGGGSVFY
jgi:hypothetical protein